MQVQAPSQLLMHDIQILVGRLVSKAKQLIQNSTTNLAENWMQIRCKFDGGKVVNRIQSGSFQFRCCGAGLQKNLGKTWGVSVWERMTGSSANEVFVNAANSSEKRVEKDGKRKSSEKAKECRRRNKYSQNDDSIAARKAYNRRDGVIEPDEVVDDISPECLQELMRTFYSTQVAVSTRDRTSIEHTTREQNRCAVWVQERAKRLTASQVGGIAKMRSNTKRSNKVKELLYSTFKGSKATMYGTLREDKAREQYVAHQQRNGHLALTVVLSGLVISVDTPWLAASPDGIVHDPTAVSPKGLVELKNLSL